MVQSAQRARANSGMFRKMRVLYCEKNSLWVRPFYIKKVCVSLLFRQNMGMRPSPAHAHINIIRERKKERKKERETTQRENKGKKEIKKDNTDRQTERKKERKKERRKKERETTQSERNKKKKRNKERQNRQTHRNTNRQNKIEKEYFSKPSVHPYWPLPLLHVTPVPESDPCPPHPPCSSLDMTREGIQGDHSP